MSDFIVDNLQIRYERCAVVAVVVMRIRLNGDAAIRNADIGILVVVVVIPFKINQYFN